MSEDLRLSEAEREELEGRLRRRSGRADEARIARVLLLLDEGASYSEIQEKVGCSAPFISKWKQRFLAERLAGLYSRHAGRAVKVLTPKMEAKSWPGRRSRRPMGRPIGALGGSRRRSVSIT